MLESPLDAEWLKENVPVDNARVVVTRLDRGTAVCVDPEGPQGVVQIECDQLGQGQAIGEGCGGHRGVLQRLGVLALGS